MRYRQGAGLLCMARFCRLSARHGLALRIDHVKPRRARAQVPSLSFLGMLRSPRVRGLCRRLEGSLVNIIARACFCDKGRCPSHYFVQPGFPLLFFQKFEV